MRPLTIPALLLASVAFCSSLCAQTAQVHRFSRQQLTGTYFSEGVAYGDINGDGINDVVYGPYWFQGPDYAQKHEIFPAQPQPMERYANHFFAWVYDFDGNGASDVLTVGFPGTPSYVYENPGKGVGQWRKHEVLDWVSNESPQWANIVGDERPELVCTRDGFFGFATVDWDNPFSSWTFHPISEQVTAAKFGHGLGIGDVNGDGRADLLHAKGWYEQPAGGALDGRWRSHAVPFSSAYGGAEMYAYDVDGDGDSDVITSEAAHDFGLSWYEQTAPGTFEQHTIMGSHPSQNAYGVLFSEPHSVNLFDVDGDGLKDIVTGKTYWSHHKQSPLWDAGAVVYWFRLQRNEDGTVTWLPFQADGEAGIGRQVVVGDVDQDGLPDIVTGGMLGAHLLTHKRVSVSAAEYQEWLPKKYEGPQLRDATDARTLRGPRSPINANGKVAEAIEAEELNVRVSAGSARPQPMANFAGDNWSGNSQLWWTGGKPGDKLTFELDAFKDIEAIQLALTCARDYGQIVLLLDGEPLGDPLELYNTEVITTGLLEFKTPGMKQGKHELTIEIVGAHAKAVKSYMVGVDYLRFRAPGQKFVTPDSGVKPVSRDGKVLNLDFETGDLRDWTVTGDAFEGQPVKGDLVAARRDDMSSQHRGDFWIGGFERLRDAPTGTLTSAPIPVTHRFASFYFAGGKTKSTRVELVAVGEAKPFYTLSGNETEALSRVVVDLRRVQGSEMQIRLVDESSGGWGHVNFDHFRFHPKRPGPLTPPSVQLVDDEYPHRGLEAELAAAAMKVPTGFSVSVLAAEPDVKQPIAMTLDDRGRIWIAEAYEYPQRAQGDIGRDRILVFEDTNGDGKLDSRKVFYEGLNLVSGLEVGFGGVWVGAAPYLMFIPDRDGDDVPDSDPQILLDGWGFHDTHETLNAFIWGPDGWLYGCHGVFTHSRVGKPGTPDQDRVGLNAGVWRYHPTRHEFEVFAHGTSNPWGVDFNSHGEAFVTACVIPHLYHLFPGGRYQRQAGQHFNPNTYDDIKTIADHLHYLGSTPHSGNGKSDEAGGGHAHAGAMIYQGGLWPSDYDGALFMNNIHGQRLNTDLLVDHGSGYTGKHGPDFLLTGDMASQMLYMRYGPDGNVVVIDWYDMQACHRREVEVHDRSNGRIYRVQYGKPQDGKPETNLAACSDLELAEYCLHENDWYVRHARRLLQERAAQGAVDQEAKTRLVEIIHNHDDDTRRLRALWAQYSMGDIDRETFRRLFSDSSPHVRSWAVRLFVEQRSGQLTGRALTNLANLAANDPSPVVRRSIASAADKLPVAQRWDLVEALVHQSADADDHNLPLMYWYAMEPLADADPDRALALGMSAGTKIPMLREFMLRRIGGSGGAEAIDRLVAALAKADSESVQSTFLDAIRAALIGQRSAPKPAQWEATSKLIAANAGNALQLKMDALGAMFGDNTSLQRLSTVVADDSAAPAARVAAITALLDVRDARLGEQLVALVNAAGTPADVRLAAIRGLGSFDSSAVADTLLAAYPKLDADQKRAAMATLASRAASARQLLTAIADKSVAAADLTADLARQIDYLGDASLSEKLAKVWGTVSETSAEKSELMNKYKSLVARGDLDDPDWELGKLTFAKTCQRCHVLFGEGQALGPDLTGSNRTNLDYLLENIVDPSAVMANEYRQSIFLTEDGQVITGIVQAENDRSVTIQTAESKIVLPKDEIAQRKASEKSMMPDNQLSQFSEHEIRSLIAYLRGEK